MSNRSIPDTPALAKLKALKADLSRANPAFAAAVAVEAEAERLCRDLRRRLVEARVAAGWDQAELARRVEYSQSTISRLESGKGDLSLKVAVRLATALGLRLEVALTPVIASAEAPPVEGEDEVRRQRIDTVEARLSQIQEAVVETLQDLQDLRAQPEPAE